jgi:nicotinamidase-related amidase
MSDPLLIVDVQLGFLNEFTRHIPERVEKLLSRGDYDPVTFTRFINDPNGPYPRYLDWHESQGPPDTHLAPELAPYVQEELVFTKPGYAGISDELKAFILERQFSRVTIVGIDTDMCVLKIALDIFDLGVRPVILIDCCASTAGLQSHLAGLAVLARNIGPSNIRDAGLGGGLLAAPTRR